METTEQPPSEETPRKEGFATPQEALASLGPLHEKIAKIADKTPSTVIKAFAPDQLDIAGLVLPPIRMRRWLYLEKIESPFLRGDLQTYVENTPQDELLENLLRTLFVLMRPGREVGALLRGNKERLDEAVDEFADSIPLAALPELLIKLATHFEAEFSPRADMAREEEGGDSPKVQPPASSATAPGAG